MSLVVSMHFSFKLDISENFTNQNSEWVFINAFFVITSLDTQWLKPIYVIAHHYLISPLIFSMICKYKTAFPPSLIPKGALSSIATAKLATDMPVCQF